MIRDWFAYTPRGRRANTERYKVAFALNGWTFGRMGDAELAGLAYSRPSTCGDVPWMARKELERRASL